MGIDLWTWLRVFSPQTAHNHVYVYSFFQALAKLPLILVDYRDIKRAGIHQSTLIKLFKVC